MKPKTIIPYDFWAANQNKKNTTTYDNVIACQTSIDEAIFLRRFIWHYESHKHENDGEVFIAPKRFVGPIGMTVYAFRKIVKKWERLKLIITISKGKKYLKWYTLDEDRLAGYFSHLYEKSKVIENDNPGYRKRQPLRLSKTTTSLNTLKNPEKENDCCDDRSGHTQRPPKSLNLSAGKAKDSPGHRLAVQLFRGVRKHMEGGPNHLPKLDKATGKRDYRNWDSTFNQFLRQYPKITEQEMSSVMAWYIPHIGQPFVPEVYAARTLCEKYLDLQRAKKRSEQDAQRKRSKRERLDDGTWTDAGDDHWESFPCSPEEAERLRKEEEEENRKMSFQCKNRGRQSIPLP